LLIVPVVPVLPYVLPAVGLVLRVVWPLVLWPLVL
jgi:hypothetical protein